jgi:hypothetical protein
MFYLLLLVLEFILLFILSRIFIKNFSYFLVKLTRNTGFAARLFHLVLLPGVVVHELAHLIVAEVMLVRTGGLSFSLEPQEDRLVLGSVGIEQTDPFRRAIIGFAPVFVGLILISVSVLFFLGENSPLSFPLNYILVFFVVFEIGNTMFSSKKDLEGTFALLVFIFAIFLAIYIIGIRIPTGFLDYLDTAEFAEIMIRGMQVLAIPIAIDLIGILITKYLSSAK